MALRTEDLLKIRAFFSPLEKRIDLLEEKFEKRFDIIDTNFDALFKRDETRQQETTVLQEQHKRLENRVINLEQKVC